MSDVPMPMCRYSGTHSGARKSALWGSTIPTHWHGYISTPSIIGLFSFETRHKVSLQLARILFQFLIGVAARAIAPASPRRGGLFPKSTDYPNNVGSGREAEQHRGGGDSFRTGGRNNKRSAGYTSKKNKGVGPTRGGPCTSRTLVTGTYVQLAKEHGRERTDVTGLCTI